MGEERPALRGRPRRLALAQLACGGERISNLERVRAAVAEAASRGADLVCLPELFPLPYPAQGQDASRFAWAEPIPGPTTEALGEAAAAAHVAVVATVFERRAPGLHHNTAVVFGPDGKLLGRYRKMHIPHDPLYGEKFYFAPGDLGFPSFDTPAGRIATLICWDQWFPEAARLAALAGAETLLYPTAIGWEPDSERKERAAQLDAWITVQRGHAIANGVFLAAVNRVGQEGALRFWGNSFVCDPFGRILARASSEKEELLVVDCDPGEIERVRRDWPFLRDRRIDAYADLSRRLRD